jgi:hypothetical protein
MEELLIFLEGVLYIFCTMLAICFTLIAFYCMVKVLMPDPEFDKWKKDKRR